MFPDSRGYTAAVLATSAKTAAFFRFSRKRKRGAGKHHGVGVAIVPEQTPGGGSPTPADSSVDGGSEQKPAQTPESGGSEEKQSYTKAEVDWIVKDRLAHQKRAVESAAKAAEQESVRKQLEEQGKFKESADQAHKRVAELEPEAEKAKRYAEILTKQLETRKKGLPPHIVGLLDKLDTVEQLEWIEANREALEPKANGHVPGTPKPDGGKALSDAQDAQNRADFARQARSYF